jgi:hypothetical protein
VKVGACASINPVPPGFPRKSKAHLSCQPKEQ